MNALEEFYQKITPQLPTQSEDTIRTQPSVNLKNASFRSTLSVQSMIYMSRIIEHSVIANRRVADVHSSFQRMSRFNTQAKLYKDIADSANGVWLYGEIDAEIEPLPRLTIIDTGSTSLVKYWWVIAYGPGLGISLVAEEQPGSTLQDRKYEAFYTFSHEAAYNLITIFHQLFPLQVPEPTHPSKF